ncbi:hypothetical protein [Microbacterium sp. 3J1]|uniref:hypothetical protein n=1 Tax=Microbacterium sp. 3J1 TaxID=861269 RepID=UPI000B25DD43|nr:hypothetical protein [Microbacterium sp. 3J1]
MEWTPDASAGDWLRDRIDDAWNGTMHDVVPRGFPAYARVLHPATVRSLPDRPVPAPEEWERFSEDERTRVIERLQDAPVTWAETAAAFDTVLHPLAQWHRIVRTPMDGDWHTRISPDGREFSAPLEGEMLPDDLATVASHLVAHTTTPDAGFVALWEGRGTLLGHLGHPPSGASSLFGDDPNHQAMLDRSTRDPFNNVFRRPTWQEGILSREVSEGPRLSLPGRDHVLFRGSLRVFEDADWQVHVPWRDRPSEARGFAPSAQAPSLLWPEDRSWVLVSEIDYDSTIIAGRRELIVALLADPRVEAFQIREGADLTWDADDLNR